MKSSINIHAVENLTPKYTGKKHENTHLWLDKFEYFCSSLHLADIQKFIFAERTLGGIASLFVKNESNIRSFVELKNKLLTEYGNQINSVKIHEILRQRHIVEEESLFEYFLKIKEIESRANLDDNALIRYVLNVINDYL